MTRSRIEDSTARLAEDVEPFAFPDDALVFWMHQGYQFMFLRAAEGDDPPVYRLSLISPRFKAGALRFNR